MPRPAACVVTLLLPALLALGGAALLFAADALLPALVPAALAAAYGALLLR